MAAKFICSIPDCGNRGHARGFCIKHYRSWKKYGDPRKTEGVMSPRGSLLKFYREFVLPYDGDDCLTWPYSRTKGYGVMTRDGRRTNVSRFLCEDIHGAPPTPQHEAAHSCGKGHMGCVTKRHLSWKSPLENAKDKILHGTTGRGNVNAKLTEAAARQIIELRGIMSQRKIAEMFGVSVMHVCHIQRGERWAWLQP